MVVWSHAASVRSLRGQFESLPGHFKFLFKVTVALCCTKQSIVEERTF